MNKVYAIATGSVLGFSGIACGNDAQIPQKDPVCSYEPVDETIAEKVARLGPNYNVCREAVPGHNSIHNKERVNVVFVGTNYDSMDTFLREMQDSIDCTRSHKGLLDTEPFASNVDKFNFWYVNDIADCDSNPLSCALLQGIDMILDNAEKCDVPNKAIIGLTAVPFRSYSTGLGFEHLNLEQMNLEGLDNIQERASREMPFVCGYASDASRRGECTPETVADALGIEGDDRELFLRSESERYETMCAAIESLRGEQNRAFDWHLCDLINSNPRLRVANVSTMSFWGNESRLPIPEVVGHELSHSFSGLRDEYVEPEILEEWGMDVGAYLQEIKDNPVNCFAANTKSECEANAPWHGMIGNGAGCFQGCGYLMEANGVPLWRSTEENKMNCLSDELGRWNTFRTCLAIEAIAHDADGACLDI